ncbi:MAG: CinA family protein [Anaerolineaceae bacterium]|nr:CinA family protein [Anaerolineaceae bacterium]
MNEFETFIEQLEEKLIALKLMLVTAESCTGGLISHLLTNVPGSSACFLGSITAYANEAKQTLLGVSPATLAAHGAVSAETAREMADGVRTALAGSFPIENLIAAAVTGIAGPGGGTPQKPVGLVWIALSTPNGTRAYRCHWSGNRGYNKEMTARQALRLVDDYLTHQELPAPQTFSD